MNSLDVELSKSFGIEFGWESFIRNRIAMYGFVKRNDGFMEDIVVSIIGDLIIDSPKFQESLTIAKSKDDPLKNIQGVVAQAIRFRLYKLMRNHNKKPAILLSELEGFDKEAVESVDGSLDRYVSKISNQLDQMDVSPKRIEVAKTLVKAKIDGVQFKDLRKKPDGGLYSKSTISAYLELIRQAAAIVVEQNEELSTLMN